MNYLQSHLTQDNFFRDEDNFSRGFYTIGKSHVIRDLNSLNRYDADNVKVPANTRAQAAQNDNALWDIDRESLHARLITA